MSRALVPLAQGFEETEAVGFIDMLRRADVEVVVAGLESGPIEGGHGLKLVPDVLLDQVADQEFDAVVLPGGAEGSRRLAESEAVARALLRAARKDKIVAAICAAPTVLARHGLLQGKRATSHISVKDQLGNVNYEDEPVVVDGRVVTSRGAGTTIAFGLELVGMLVGGEKAQLISDAIHFKEKILFCS